MTDEMKLTDEETAQLEGAQEWVDRQAEALERLRPAWDRLNAGEPLTRQDRTTLAVELGLAGDELDEAHRAEPNEVATRNIFREPLAHFTIRRDDGEYQVQVRPGGDVRVVRETDVDALV